MCAGRCREPRRKGTRVAAPSGCIVPWAARASCWPQPQQLLPVSAAGSGRRCCTGAFLPAGLFGRSMLFESTLAVPFARQIKQKLRYCWVSVKQFSKNDTATACQDWLRSTRLGRGSIKSHVRTVKVLGMGLFAFQERIHLWKGVTH